MKKCIIIPDSFKGTMSSIEVSDIIAGEVKKVYPECEIIQIPVADGGEGTVDCFLNSMSGEKVEVEVKGPFGEPVNSFYGIIESEKKKTGAVEKTAIIEMAAAAGLPLAYGKLDPMASTTYGVGELVLHAVKNGCKKIILGLGGSCTNDCGAGMAAALGTVFKDKNGREFVPSGGTLKDVTVIDCSKTQELLNEVTIEAMCDIDNPMFGTKGAAYIFAPQKGASESQVIELDNGLRHLASVIEACCGCDVGDIPGSGAAGAMGAGVVAFLDGKLASGIELVLETVGFDSILSGCDVVFTGEGKLDSQSLGGKVISGVASHAKVQGVPVIVVCGIMEAGIEEGLRNAGVHKAWPVYDSPQNLEEILLTCKDDLRKSIKILLSSTNLNLQTK